MNGSVGANKAFVLFWVGVWTRSHDLVQVNLTLALSCLYLLSPDAGANPFMTTVHGHLVTT